VPELKLVSIKLYDLLGTEVKTIVNKEYAPGTYSVEFNAEGLSSGVYLYKFTSGDFSTIKKMQVIK
jgi:hypothetical protein